MSKKSAKEQAGKELLATIDAYICSISRAGRRKVTVHTYASHCYNFSCFGANCN